MYRTFVKNTTMALGTLLVGSALVFAAGTPGAVTALDGKGMATVHTSDGKDHQVKAGEGWKVGAKVECDAKNNVLECKPTQAQAAATTAPSMASPAHTTTAPAPAPATSAPVSSSTTATPGTATPAPASK